MNRTFNRGVVFGGLLAVASQAYAVSANPGVRTFTQPDGTRITGTLQGDEWYHWYRTTDGRVFIRNPATGVYEYARLGEKNGRLQLVSTGAKVGGGFAAPSTAAAVDDRTLFQIGANERVRAGVTFDKTPKLDKAKEHGLAALAVAPRTFKTLVVMVEFSDYRITSPVNTWATKIFGTAEGQMNHFYNDTTQGKVQFVPAAESEGVANDGFVRVRLSYPHPHPRDDSDKEDMLLRDALLLADAYVDFSRFDNNGDGLLTGDELQLGFMVAGPEYAYGNDGFWAHSSTLPDAPTLDSVTVGARLYFSFGERHGDHDATIGVIAHELGHSALGLPDMYPALGGWDLMADGSWGSKSGDAWSGQTPVGMSAHTKWKLGFIDPAFVSPMYAGTTLTLQDAVGSTPDLVVTRVPAGFAGYFALEHRRIEGYDRGMNRYRVPTGHNGLLVFAESGSRDGLSLVRAVVTDDATTDLFYPGNNDRLAPDTTPNSNDRHSDTATGYIFDKIAYSGDAMTVRIDRAPTVPGADCRLFVSSNSAHVSAGRAYTKTSGTWWKTTTYYAVGSNESLGTVATTQVTLKEAPEGHYAKGSCPTQNAPRFSDVVVQPSGATASISARADDLENDLAAVEMEIDGSGVWESVSWYVPEGERTWWLSGWIPRLSAGTHSIRLRATDAGNRVTLYGPVQFQSEGPRAPICTIDRVHRDSEGYYTAWGQSDDPDGGTLLVEVSFNHGAWRRARVDWSGWNLRLSQQPNDLAAGTYTVAARVTDDAGLTGQCGPFQLEVGVDHAPLATITGQTQRGDSVSLNGEASDVDGDLAGVEVEYDGNGQWRLIEGFNLSNPALGYWYLDQAGFAPGSHTARVRGVDASGLRGAPSEAAHFEVKAPADPFCAITQVQYEDTNLIIRGSLGDANDDIVRVESFLLDTREWVPMMYFGGNELWAIASSEALPPGQYTAQIRVSDERGSYGYCSKPFTLGVAPVMGNVEVTVSGNSATLNGQASDADNDLQGVELSLDAPDNWVGVAVSNGRFSHTLANLAVGQHVVHIRARDATGRDSPELTMGILISAGSTQCYTTTNTAHATAGRATQKYSVLYYANGSNEYLGIGSATTSLQQQAPGSWKKVTSCP